MKSLKSFLFANLILLLSSNLFSQQDSVCMSKDQVQLHFLPSYAISYLNSLSQNSAIRYSVSLSLNVSGGTNDNDYNVSQDQMTKTKITSDENFQSVSLTAIYMGFSYKHKYGKLYYGAGPTLNLSRDNSQTNREGKSSSGLTETTITEISDYSTSSVGIGVAGVLGLECYITEGLSIIGELQMNAIYSWDKADLESNQLGYQSNFNISSKTSGNSWGVNLRGFLLGIALQF